MPPSIDGVDVYELSAVPPSMFIAVGSTKLSTPDPFVLIIWFAEPSELGKVKPVSTTFPVPATDKVKLAFDGADKVDPTALRSPRLVEEPPPPPVLIAIPPAVDPSPSRKLPVSTSTAR